MGVKEGREGRTLRRQLKRLREPRYAFLLVGFFIFSAIGALVFAWATLTIRDEAAWKGWPISLAASFVEDWVFFVVVGGALALFSLSRPEEDDIRKRIKFLYNGRNVTDDAIDYFEKMARQECSFSPIYTYTIVYTEYDVVAKSIKATVQIDRKLVNMLSDRDYVDTDIGCSVYTDEIPELTGCRGEVLMARISYDDGALEDFVTTPRKVFKSKESVPVSVKLKPDGEANLLFKFWVWHKIGEPYTVTAHKYSDQRVVEIVNNSECEIIFSIEGKGDPLILTPGSREPIVTSRIPKGSEQLFVLKEVQAVANPGGGA